MAATTRFDTDPSQASARKARPMLRPALMAACAIAITFAASGKVLAQDDDQTPEPSLMDKVMKGLGAEGSSINYRERSPLVIPPNTDLPPPEDGKKVAVAPNWPKDPDLTKAKEASAARKKNARASGTSAALYTNDVPLSSTELNKGMTPESKRTAVNTDAPGGDTSAPLYPDQLGYKGNLFSGWFKLPGTKDAATFTGEPERSTLADPPPGYQTPSPNYEYGVDPNTKDSTMRQTDADKRIYNGAPN
jgi:hypothetical protein